MNHNTRIKGTVVRGSRTMNPNQTLMKIAGHEERIFVKFFRNDLDGFDAFWNGLKADMPDHEERLEYLENLCPDCNHERDAIKGRWICLECFNMDC